MVHGSMIIIWTSTNFEEDRKYYTSTGHHEKEE
jgi:hypothetical protein